MGIFTGLKPSNNFARRYEWEQKRRRLRKGMTMRFSSGQVVHIDLFKHMKRHEREEQRCRNAGRKSGEEAITPRCRLQPPYLNQRPKFGYRLLRSVSRVLA